MEKSSNTKSSNRKVTFKEVLQTFKSARRLLAYSIYNFPVLSIGNLISMLVTSSAPILESWFYGKLFDTLIKSATSQTLLSGPLLLNLGLLVLIGFVSDIFFRLNTYFDINAQEKMMLKTSRDFSEKIASLDQEYFDNPKTNDLINKVTNRYQQTNWAFLRDMFQTIEILFTIVFNLTVLITLSPFIIILSIVISIPESIVNAVTTKKSYKLWGEMAEVRRDSGKTRDFIKQESTLKEVKIFDAVDYMINRFVKIDTDYSRKNMKIHNRALLLSSFMGIFQHIGFAAIIVLLTSYVIAQKITVGTLTFYVTSTNRVRNNISRFFGRLTRLYENGLYVNDYYKFMDLKPIIKNGSVKIGHSQNPPKIEFKNVWFKYPNNDKYILKNFNLTLNPEEHLAIVGENGAGKTTIIKLLMRFYTVTKGKILINGTDINDLDINSWYTQVGTLFQEYNFYHFDAKTNIGIGSIPDIDNINDIIESSKQSGAHDFIEKYDRGYEQIMEKSFSGGINPSTGQKQRIALARAFFKNPKILILDEPTSSIDAKGEYEIFERLFDFAKDKTVIIISHRFSTVRNASRIIVLDEGRIVEEGIHSDLVNISNGRYKVAFELQKKGYE